MTDNILFSYILMFSFFLFHNFLFSQLYADDTSIFNSFSKYDLSSTIFNISSCIGKMTSWSDSVSQTQPFESLTYNLTTSCFFDPL